MYYRIYEHYDGIDKTYTVRKKFLWWYTDQYDAMFLQNYYGCTRCPQRFKSLKDAEEAIKKSETTYENKLVKTL